MSIIYFGIGECRKFLCYKLRHFMASSLSSLLPVEEGLTCTVDIWLGKELIAEECDATRAS